MHDILKAGFVESLVWEGDELVDWVNGGMRFRLDGSAVESRVRYGYRFDAVCASNGYAVIYERLGTKGLILRNGVILREISRSFYRADDYEYPICLWTGSQGRTLMAHCPEEYNRIEIDDVQTGERLTGAGDREPSDFFHSSLQASPGGTRLLSAGWIWSPWETVCFFDVSQALRDPRHLDDAKHDGKRWPCGSVEESSACWQTEDRILIAGNVDDFFDQEEQPEVRLGPNNIMVYDVSAASCIRTVPVKHPLGKMMPAGNTSVVTFYQYPRLFSLTDGSIIEEWPDLPTGLQASCIDGGGAPPPPFAMDPANGRFAVACGGEIHVISV